MIRLNVDCLDEIFRYFEEDKAVLHSCLLVNRFWCKVSVRILWETPNVTVEVLNTLITCLPDESKEFLYKVGTILTPTPCEKELLIKGKDNHWPLSFIEDFKNLQELEISLSYVSKEDDGYSDFEHFEDLQYFTFPHLKKLNINLPKKVEPIVVKFLENNGENLVEFQSNYKSINRAVSDYCPKLKSLHTTFGEKFSGLLLRNILKKCKKLESIEPFRRGSNLSGKELLKIVAENSPKNFHELNLHNYYEELDAEDLKSFFISWEKRNPLKLLTLIIKNGSSRKNDEKEAIINEYERKGVIKILKM
ncbi:hypothetical protein RhiirA4_500968 [Rhizophagus irregularis]|uniref:F-box domain-containing protein n=1 Tax=Rhizophagus irregularis TaxID=588596 RepID=A0A2I1G4N2_9GLOM|nr:hypothetical protein RhiirA4_500968 [Rhizophagus irregularis]